MKNTDNKPSRDGKRFLGGYFDASVAKRVRTLSIEEDTTVQDLIGEAITLLLDSRNIKIGK